MLVEVGFTSLNEHLLTVELNEGTVLWNVVMKANLDLYLLSFIPVARLYVTFFMCCWLFS